MIFHPIQLGLVSFCHKFYLVSPNMENLILKNSTCGTFAMSIDMSTIVWMRPNRRVGELYSQFLRLNFLIVFQVVSFFFLFMAFLSCNSRHGSSERITNVIIFNGHCQLLSNNLSKALLSMITTRSSLITCQLCYQ